jgi:hypothetical protein
MTLLMASTNARYNFYFYLATSMIYGLTIEKIVHKM